MLIKDRPKWDAKFISKPSTFYFLLLTCMMSWKNCLSKLTDDTKLSGIANALKYINKIQIKQGKWEKWDRNNRIKCNRNKCKVLHLGNNNKMCEYLAWNTWFGTCETSLGIVGDCILKMSIAWLGGKNKSYFRLHQQNIVSISWKMIVPICLALVSSKKSSGSSYEYQTVFWMQQWMFSFEGGKIWIGIW